MTDRNPQPAKPQTFDEWVGLLSAHNFADKHPSEARAFLSRFWRWAKFDDGTPCPFDDPDFRFSGPCPECGATEDELCKMK